MPDSTVNGPRPMQQERQAPRQRRRAAGLAAIGAVSVLALLSGCTADWDAAPWDRELPSVEAVSALRAAPNCTALTDAAEPALSAAVDAMWPATDRGWFSGGGDDDQVDASTGAADVPSSRLSESPAPTTMPSAASPEALGSDTTGRVVIGTNNQEQEVDESDLFKTDGDRIVAITDGVLRVVHLDGSPAVDGTLDLSTRGAQQLFLRGDTALVLGTTFGGRSGHRTFEDRTFEDGAAAGEVAPSTSTPTTSSSSTTTTTTTTIPDTPTTTATSSTTTSTSTTSTTTTVPIVAPPFATATTLTLVDLGGAAAPSVISTADIEGSMVTARQIDGRARVVVQSSPEAIEQLYTARSRDEATAVVRTMEADDLLPRVALDGQVGDLGACDDVLLALSPAAPEDTPSAPWSGDPAATLSTVTVVTVGDDLTALDPVSVQGAAETVYASTDSLFVAAGSWDEGGSRTDVHRFDLGSDGPATYTGSGRAPGRLLNQFSLSERDGALRLVTTLDGTGVAMPVEPDTRGLAEDDGVTADIVSPTGQSSARLTVLDTDGTLDEIGHLDGMGIGETVHSVRFLDDIAYLVTFRQIDPLYAVDLSDPRNPALLGELKIPGFSEYLHPVGDGLLLGVGREVDPATGIDSGLKVSLFDVSDPVQMAEVDQIIVGDAWSAISDDHKAFTWDPVRRRAIIPVERGCAVGGGFTEEPMVDGEVSRWSCQPDGVAQVVQIDGNSLTEVARVGHVAPGSGPGSGTVAPIRSSIVDDDLWTLSMVGLGRSDVDAPTGVTLLGF